MPATATNGVKDSDIARPATPSKGKVKLVPEKQVKAGNIEEPKAKSLEPVRSKKPDGALAPVIILNPPKKSKPS